MNADIRHFNRLYNFSLRDAVHLRPLNLIFYNQIINPMRNQVSTK